MRTHNSRVQIITLVCASEDGAFTRRQFPMQYLVSAVLKTLADVTDAQHTSIPAQAMLHY